MSSSSSDTNEESDSKRNQAHQSSRKEKRRRYDDHEAAPDDIISGSTNSSTEGAFASFNINNRSSIRIDEPRPNDVLLGRGKSFQLHPGNKIFLQAVRQQKEKYRGLQRKYKRPFAEEFLKKFLNLGARFLRCVEQDYEEGYWEEITFEAACDKVSHALRERTGENQTPMASQATTKQGQESNQPTSPGNEPGTAVLPVSVQPTPRREDTERIGRVPNRDPEQQLALSLRQLLENRNSCPSARSEIRPANTPTSTAQETYREPVARGPQRISALSSSSLDQQQALGLQRLLGHRRLLPSARPISLSNAISAHLPIMSTVTLPATRLQGALHLGSLPFTATPRAPPPIPTTSLRLQPTSEEAAVAAREILLRQIAARERMLQLNSFLLQEAMGNGRQNRQASEENDDHDTDS